MTPAALTPAEFREAVLASLAHSTLTPMPPDPSLRFVVDLGLRRPPISRRTAP